MGNKRGEKSRPAQSDSRAAFLSCSYIFFEMRVTRPWDAHCVKMFRASRWSFASIDSKVINWMMENCSGSRFDTLPKSRFMYLKHPSNSSVLSNFAFLKDFFGRWEDASKSYFEGSHP